MATAGMGETEIIEYRLRVRVPTGESAAMDIWLGLDHSEVWVMSLERDFGQSLRR